jgi:hypothetical protein
MLAAMTQQTDRTVPPEFKQLSRSLLGVCALLDADLRRNFVAGSPAYLETRDEPLAGGMGRRPALNAVMTASSVFNAGVDHIRAICALIDTEGIVQSIGTVARGALEELGQANYLLKPPVDSRERVRRHQNMRLHDFYDQIGVLRRLPLDQAVAHDMATLRRMRDDPLDAAEIAGFRVENRNHARWAAQLKPRRPSMRDLCAETVVFAGADRGAAMYGYLSTMAHS